MNELIEKEVELVIKVKELPPVEDRIKQVQGLIDWMIDVLEVKPPAYQLELMASYLLADVLRDKSTHKVKQTEFPILSATQVKLRNRRERRVGDDNLDFIKGKEVDNNPNAFKSRTQNKDE